MQAEKHTKVDIGIYYMVYPDYTIYFLIVTILILTFNVLDEFKAGNKDVVGLVPLSRDFWSI